MAATDETDQVTYSIHVTGLVQGVGFRPFIRRLAGRHGLTGWVENRNDGVWIRVRGLFPRVKEFREGILHEAPDAAGVETIRMEKAPPASFDGFEIRSSRDASDRITRISPDIAVCADCLRDMVTQTHRIAYPFVNCTHCGPRFTILRDLPYDRSRTTMEPFEMCPDCRREYGDVNDRRFHAQPVACNRCGPVCTLSGQGREITRFEEILTGMASGLGRGGIFAVKGLGGFHLICDAFNGAAVERMRTIKERDAKPFALMFRSVEAAREVAEIGPAEEKLLTSWRRPIVLLRKRSDPAHGICDGLDSLGIMLPYMPFHHLLFDRLETKALVMTSGNLSDEPVLIHNEQALHTFGDRLDGVLTYNREILNRCDDSVSRVVGGTPRLVRRSRGYVPTPLRCVHRTEGIFAAGAELVSSFAIGKDSEALLSPYIGDLKNLETFRFYGEIYDRYCRMFRFRPELVVHDLHPDYLSTRFARELAEKMPGVEVFAVQHHHAHVASVMAENRVEGEVIGFSFDGMGLGGDGTLWGAEALVAGYREYTRMVHFEQVPLPGGDRANEEPWRMAVSYLFTCFGEEFLEWDMPFMRSVSRQHLDGVVGMLKNGVNAPPVSSAGRLFDAMASLLGITQSNAFQAEAPMKLEAMADPAEEGAYPYIVGDGLVSFRPMFEQVVAEIRAGVSAPVVSARFHNTLIRCVLELAGMLRRESAVKQVVLSGGSFQNRNLLGGIEKGLEARGFDVIRASGVPVNDQGIALGQLAIAAARREG